SWEARPRFDRALVREPSRGPRRQTGTGGEAARDAELQPVPRAAVAAGDEAVALDLPRIELPARLRAEHVDRALLIVDLLHPEGEVRLLEAARDRLARDRDLEVPGRRAQRRGDRQHRPERALGLAVRERLAVGAASE